MKARAQKWGNSSSQGDAGNLHGALDAGPAVGKDAW